MHIAELSAPHAFRVIEAPVPDLGRGEILVEVAACGVCTSELSDWTGMSHRSYPARIGHEVSGTVAATGPDAARFSVGEPVAVWTTGAGYADFVAVQEEYCRALPDSVPLDTALIEPVACAANAVELADVRLGDRVLIVGGGFMGQLVCRLVALRGAREVIVADTRPDALAVAARHGATRIIDSSEVDVVEAVADLTAGDKADITFEVTGSQSALDLIGDCTRMSGKLVLVGFHQGEPRAVPMAQWNWMAFTLLNAHFREVATIMRGMTIGARLLGSGQLQLTDLITHRYGLPLINDAFADAVRKPPGFLKAVITMSSTAAQSAQTRDDHD